MGIISTLCGEVSILVISVFVPGLSELYIYVVYVWMDMIVRWDPIGMGPYRPQETVTLCTIPANERPAIRQKGHTYQSGSIYMLYFYFFIYFRLNSSLKFLTAKFLVQCYRVLLMVLYLTDNNK